MFNIFINDNDAFNFTIQSLRERKDIGKSVGFILANKVFSKIREDKLLVSIDDLYSAVVYCFNYYNDFITRKKIHAPLISEDEYDAFMVACVLFVTMRGGDIYEQ